jgi:FMN phosphatase YigB (HAD superfamily)
VEDSALHVPRKRGRSPTAAMSGPEYARSGADASFDALAAENAPLASAGSPLLGAASPRGGGGGVLKRAKASGEDSLRVSTIKEQARRRQLALDIPRSPAPASPQVEVLPVASPHNAHEVAELLNKPARFIERRHSYDAGPPPEGDKVLWPPRNRPRRSQRLSMVAPVERPSSFGEQDSSSARAFTFRQPAGGSSSVPLSPQPAQPAAAADTRPSPPTPRSPFVPPQPPQPQRSASSVSFAARWNRSLDAGGAGADGGGGSGASAGEGGGAEGGVPVLSVGMPPLSLEAAPVPVLPPTPLARSGFFFSRQPPRARTPTRNSSGALEGKAAALGSPPSSLLRACAGPGCEQHEKKERDFGACAGCRQLVYCSRACQERHWLEGGHRQACSGGSSAGAAAAAAGGGASQLRASASPLQSSTLRVEGMPRLWWPPPPLPMSPSPPYSPIVPVSPGEPPARRAAAGRGVVSGSGTPTHRSSHAARSPGSSGLAGEAFVAVLGLSSPAPHGAGVGAGAGTGAHDDWSPLAADRAPAPDSSAMERVEAELPLPPSHIKLVLFDMDRTLLQKHTSGCFRGDIEVLSRHVTAACLHVIPRLLENGFFVGVVTFSDSLCLEKERRDGLAGEELVRRLLQSALRREFARREPQLSEAEANERARGAVARIYVAAANPSLRNREHPRSRMPENKQWHIGRILNNIRLREGVKIGLPEILFFDDSDTNVRNARHSGVHAFRVDQRTALTVRHWVEAIERLPRGPLDRGAGPAH